MALSWSANELEAIPEHLQALALQAVRALVMRTGLDSIHLATIRYCTDWYPVEFKRAYEAYRDRQDAAEFFRHFPGVIYLPTHLDVHRTLH